MAVIPSMINMHIIEQFCARMNLDDTMKTLMLLRELTTSQPVDMATCSDSGFHNIIDLIQRRIPTHNVCNEY
jgi:hypothetical protein